LQTCAQNNVCGQQKKSGAAGGFSALQLQVKSRR